MKASASFRANVSEHRASILVAALSSAFGVALLLATGILSTFVAASPMGAHGTVQAILPIVAGVFIVIAVYVGAIVTTNTFATIVAGRSGTIALLRLLGSSANALRRSIAAEGLIVGVVGALAGAVVALVGTVIGVRALVAGGVLPDLAYDFAPPQVALPVAAVVVVTWASSWIGSRRVLVVTPMQAAGAAEDPGVEPARSHPAHTALVVALVVIGVAGLVAGMLAGLVSVFGVLIALAGGIVSFTGVVAGAHLVMPKALAGVGRLAGRSAPSRLAAANAVRNPRRSARATIGLVIGVTLITMFAVATASYRNMILAAQARQPQVYQGAEQVLDVTTAVFSILIGFAAVIAAVGMMNNLSLSVLQRRRELGLLRTLGFSGRQVRDMILAESVQMVAASVLTGLVLGIFYGWAGAQALLGSIPAGGGIVVPGMPWTIIVVVVVAAAALALVASIAPTRRARRVTPVEALA